MPIKNSTNPLNTMCTTNRTIVVTGCDANHYDLVTELLHSLLRFETNNYDIGYLHVGDDKIPSHLSKLADIVVNCPFSDLKILPNNGFQLAALGVKARLPEFFPGYDTYVWLDADVWVQNVEGIDEIIECASLADICIHPQLDPNYYQCLSPDDYTLSVYTRMYGDADRHKYSRFPMINSGVFGAKAASPLWAKWKEELLKAKDKFLSVENGFLSDQIPLHKLVFSSQLKIYPLCAENNWLVLHGFPRIDPQSGILTTPTRPFRPINIIHLIGASKRTQYKIGSQVVSYRYKYIQPLQAKLADRQHSISTPVKAQAQV